MPYLFLTGYDGWSLPDSYRAALRFAKPFSVEQVIATLAQIAAAGEVA